MFYLWDANDLRKRIVDRLSLLLNIEDSCCQQAHHDLCTIGEKLDSGVPTKTEAEADKTTYPEAN
jgi:hypothetical protein